MPSPEAVTQADVVVIGLGAMGAHAAAELARRGARVIGLERFEAGHERGSSHGDTRIIRLGYFEDPCYVPLLHRAYAAWRELERRSGAALLTITGVLQIGRPEGSLVSGTLASCRLHGLDHEVLDRAAMAARYPVFALDAGEVAVFEPQGGYLRAALAVATAQRLAAEDGATLRFNERVLAVEPHAGGVEVRTEAGTVRARRAVVAGGSYIADLVPRLRGVVDPIRTVVGWFRPDDATHATPDRMPVFLRQESEETGGGSFFGFPVLGPEGVKVGRHAHFNEPVDTDAPNPPANPRDRAYIEAYLRRRVPGAAGPATGFMTCRYTNLPGEDFLIDRLPDAPEIVVASPCSGHGFKFASVIGEILADLALEGATAQPIAPFSFAALDRQVARALPRAPVLEPA